MKTPLRRAHIVPAIVGLVLLLAAGVGLIFAYATKEQGRDLRTWETLLGAAADSRAQGVGQWLDAQAAVVQELADNASVRFYLTQISAADANAAAAQPAQAAYLRNLLEATAERSRFSGVAAQARVPANIDLPVDSGLVVVDHAGRPVAETTGFRTDDTLRATLLQALKTGKPVLQDFYENGRGEVMIGYAIPIFHVQLATSRKEPIGAVAGVKRARDELFPLLSRKGTLTSADETLLVRREGDLVSYITPLADGTPSLRKRLPVATRDLAEAQALAQPGSFGVMRDYSGREVLMVSRGFSQAPWVLVQKVDASEALRESREHQRFMLISLFLAALVATASFIAAWWHGASVKERSVAADLRAKSREIAHQSALLQSVTDGTPDLIFIVGDQRLRFCNKALSDLTGENPDLLTGKTLSSVFGPAAAQPINSLVENVLAKLQSSSRMVELEIGGTRKIYYSTALPIAPGADGRQVLCICRDMTAEQQAQARQQALMEGLVTTLTSIVDIHDPFCAGHSTRTAQVAVALGKALGLDAAALETIHLAATLANVGKMFLPRELLTKSEPLTAEEQALLHSHVQRSVDILKGLDFAGPVINVIAQKSEHVDGSGYPNGLKGDDLLLASRILAVANAFVAMASARAYRAGMPVKETLDQLLGEADARYDRHVVAALFHVAENRQEWVSWSLPDNRGT
ncbi:MAG: PAS domain-containing protein [Gammaproteobacteria bacterium]|nr:PAS domain-containing protein [Gammaproteobacteria bacterium]MBU3990573.1 PAS domain-containing protein [Gammaproteobacteria bacterium]MBU4005770.1 PAS domain-containing protein [Gammaproteobacteria bacterium]MBU4021482.1 PAS domain-containing protein [Gammaproteobacteria bacterium]MBU4097330.1 PAS domain-containing protein [Gammaproteobacteria bacterium]